MHSTAILQEHRTHQPISTLHVSICGPLFFIFFLPFLNF
uniref:Uncharacterized protein n=1 Tax=Anguilla anguilla TaxID=7936 RepID=A0A0E9WNH5_ANGAN